MRRLLVWATAVVLIGTVCSGAAGAAPASSLRGSWKVVPTVDTAGFSNNQLLAVSGSSASDLWAVGVDDSGTLAEHWDGSAWSHVPTPNVAGGFANDFLTAVSARAPDDAWAVGLFADRAPPRPLAEHFDGSAWSVVPVAEPTTGGQVVLSGVLALAPDDVWAVGNWMPNATSGGIRTLTEHWDGHAWSVVPSPSTGGQHVDFLAGIDGTAPDDIWAVGVANDDRETLALHWNGVRWSRVPSPSPPASNALLSVTALGRDDVWAAGYTDGAERGLIEHWDGRRWSVSAKPPVGPPGLTSIAALSPDDVWAVGGNRPAGRAVVTAAVHWDGRAWSRVPTPNPNRFAADTLYGLTAASGQLWAVGISDPERSLAERLIPEPVLDAGFGDVVLHVRVGLGTAWHIPATDARSHGVSDGTGLALFRSGLRPPGGSFSFTFPAAGRYAVTDPANGARQSVAVSLFHFPANGTANTRFRLQWAIKRAPAGRVFDVEIERPGDSAFTAWRTGVTNATGGFTADRGPGSYAFRARLRSLAGVATGWSPSLVLDIGS